jgi:hypothetical protein
MLSQDAVDWCVLPALCAIYIVATLRAHIKIYLFKSMAWRDLHVANTVQNIITQDTSACFRRAVWHNVGNIHTRARILVAALRLDQLNWRQCGPLYLPVIEDFLGCLRKGAINRTIIMHQRAACM